MDCTEIRPLISYYYDGEASPDERAQVERHLADCGDCRRALAEYRAIGGDIRDLSQPVPPVGLRRDVWRRIEAQQAGGRAVAAPIARPRPNGKVVTFPNNTRRPAWATIMSNAGSGWSKTLAAALLIGALFVVLGVLIMMQNTRNVSVARLVEDPPYSDYNKTVKVFISKDVDPADVEANTQVWHLKDGAPAGKVDVNLHYIDAGGQGGTLEISPKPAWDAGAAYRIHIEAANVRTYVANNPLADKPSDIDFSTVAPPTSTPEPTNTPTNTPVIEPTLEPTAVAVLPSPTEGGVPPVIPASPTAPVVSDTPVPVPSNTTAPSVPTNTAVPVPPTATRVPPTNTPVRPTNTPVPPTATNTTEPEPTATPVVSATPTIGVPTATSTPRKPTATATITPVRGTPTPKPPCNIMPVNGFGKIWTEMPGVRDRVGCPNESETAIQEAAHQRFQGGYMFWRGDLKKIYVFVGSPSDMYGTWYEFDDTWQEGELMPQPTSIPPSGYYQPVRGFGKVYYDPANTQMRLALGWALEDEQAVTAAFQTYERGVALWTSDKVIRFMYLPDHLWQYFTDTYVMPTP